MTKSRSTNPDVALQKMRKYCAYQERCHQEVRHKLIALGMRGDTLEKIVGQLIEEGFLDEERFARSFARGKFRTKGWGKQKISQELKQRQIGSYLLNKALDEIEEGEYRASLQNLLEKKQLSLLTYPEAEQKIRLFKFAFQRGFEADLIYEYIPQFFDNTQF